MGLPKRHISLSETAVAFRKYDALYCITLNLAKLDIGKLAVAGAFPLPDQREFSA